jgi:hypothetical protein
MRFRLSQGPVSFVAATIFSPLNPQGSLGLLSQMRVFALVPHPLGKLNGRAFSSLTSIRLRCLEIAPYLPKLGHNLKLVNDRDVPAIVGDGAYTGTRKSHHLAAGAGAGYP